MTAASASFDRTLTLEELIPQQERSRLAGALEALVGCAVRLVDSRGERLCGAEAPLPRVRRIALEWEFEPVGYLETGCDDDARCELAVEWLTLVMKATARYHMASELHRTAIDSDYEALQEKHAALLASEQRYRELSEQLERRVVEQVSAIEAAQRSLYQSEKLASVGRLAAGMAHEINNPIGFIRSNLGSARAYVSDLAALGARVKAAPGTADQYWQAHGFDELLADFDALLEESIGGADRIARIIADLKVFSRVDQAGEESCDLGEIVRSACTMLAPQTPAGVSVECALGPLPLVRGSAARLGEMLYNVVQNAIQAAAPSGAVTIAAHAAEGWLTLEIADTGPGIPVALRERIFDPFFTTRQVGEGTGLGLTVAGDIAKQHGGRIAAVGRDGGGTVLRIALPAGVPGNPTGGNG